MASLPPDQSVLISILTLVQDSSDKLGILSDKVSRLEERVEVIREGIGEVEKDFRREIEAFNKRLDGKNNLLTTVGAGVLGVILTFTSTLMISNMDKPKEQPANPGASQAENAPGFDSPALKKLP